jgi:hypothetical protein
MKPLFKQAYLILILPIAALVGVWVVNIYLALLAALFFKFFWNHSLPAFGMRPISYGEACCFLLLLVVTKAVLEGIKVSAKLRD